MAEGLRFGTRSRTMPRVLMAAAAISIGNILHAEELRQLEGLLEPEMTVDLASPVSGVIESLDVERGDLVSEGQLIGKLNDRVQQAQVELAEARVNLHGEISAREAALELAARREERTTELYAKRVIPLDDKDEAEAKARVAEQDLHAARERRKIAGYELALARQELALRQIRSPVSGVVVDRMMSPGSHVDEEPIVRIAKIDPLRVETVVPVDYFGAITTGMQARIEPELPVADGHYATVVSVDRAVDAASGTFTVRLSLPNPDGRLPSGLKCKVVFDQGLVRVFRPAEPAPATEHPGDVDSVVAMPASPMPLAPPVEAPLSQQSAGAPPAADTGANGARDAHGFHSDALAAVAPADRQAALAPAVAGPSPPASEPHE